MPYFNYEDKKVYFNIQGEGKPIILIHGNTVSSKLFSSVKKMYSNEFQVIVFDFPGHGKSDRVGKFETDFWYYNSKVCDALIEHLNFKKVNLIGTSGGALVAINLALEHPEKVNYLFADSFEGEYPLDTYISSLENDREADKKKLLAKIYWFFCHGYDWKKVVDSDTEVNVEFAKTGKSFFQKSISELLVPTLITGSMKDEYCNQLDKIYGALKEKNPSLEVHLLEEGKHPSMLSNKKEFFELVKQRIG